MTPDKKSVLSESAAVTFAERYKFSLGVQPNKAIIFFAHRPNSGLLTFQLLSGARFEQDTKLDDRKSGEKNFWRIFRNENITEPLFNKYPGRLTTWTQLQRN